MSGKLTKLSHITQLVNDSSNRLQIRRSLCSALLPNRRRAGEGGLTEIVFAKMASYNCLMDGLSYDRFTQG